MISTDYKLLLQSLIEQAEKHGRDYHHMLMSVKCVDGYRRNISEVDLLIPETRY